MNKSLLKIVTGTLLLGTATMALGQGSAPTAPDAIGTYVLAKNGEQSKMPQSMQPFIRRNLDEVQDYYFNLVRHGDYLRPLPAGEQVDVDLVINGHRENIASFMERYYTAGIIVVKDGKVVVERYRFGNGPHSRWDIASVTKSVMSTALAAAIKDGKIGSIDDPLTKYLPELKGSNYDGVKLRDALNMSSGIDREDGDPKNAELVAAFNRASASKDPNAVTDYLRSLPRRAAPGSWFAYDSVDSFVLGEVVRRTTGKSLAAYISEKIWTPGGMEEDAYMRSTALGKESSSGGLSATLRDMARFGMFVIDGGKAGGKQIVPADWFPTIIKGVTDPKSVRHPGNIGFMPETGYMHQWWLLPKGGTNYSLGDDDGFIGLGANGQQLIVVPKQNMVVFIQSADPEVTSGVWLPGRALATAIAQKLKK